MAEKEQTIRQQLQAIAGGRIAAASVGPYQYAEYVVADNEILVKAPEYDAHNGARYITLMTIDDAEQQIAQAELSLSSLQTIHTALRIGGDKHG